MDHLWIWLVVDLPLLKNMSSSIGMMTVTIYGKIKNVPHHQPVYIYIYICIYVCRKTNDIDKYGDISYNLVKIHVMYSLFIYTCIYIYIYMINIVNGYGDDPSQGYP